MRTTMATSRRTFLIQSMLCGMGTAFTAFRPYISSQANPIYPLMPGAAVEAFKKEQQKLLDKYRVAATSKYINLSMPKMKAHVLETGSGDPIVMLHGGGAGAYQFIPLMEQLQNHYHLYVPDRPGCGLSDRIDYTGVPFPQHAIDYVTSIFDSLHIAKAPIIGNSMGGYWGLLFAIAYPDRVTKLILPGMPADTQLHLSIPVPLSKPHPTIENVRGLYQFLLVDDINHVAEEMLRTELANDNLSKQAAGWDTMIEEFNKQPHLGIYHLRPEMKTLSIPTLFIWGEQEKLGPPKCGQEMAALMPHGRCVILKNARHLPWLDYPDKVAQLIVDFLEEKN